MKARKKTAATIDPTQIQNPAGIPPPGSHLAGTSLQSLVDIYNGTIRGDVDAVPAAAELLSAAPNTPNASNADFIYSQVAALYDGADLPNFQSPSGKSVKSLVFVSGSKQGGYGAFHINDGGQTNFDRIVVDSLTSSGNYSDSSGLGSPTAHLAPKIPHLLPEFGKGTELRCIFDPKDARLRALKPQAVHQCLKITQQSAAALKHAVEVGNPSAIPKLGSSGSKQATSSNEPELARRLAQSNTENLELVAAAVSVTASRKYLSTALFGAELVESFQTLTGKGDPGRTDGEAVSRVLAFKLAPEIALVPGFNSGITQQWWQDGHPDWVNDNSQSDQSTDGNAAGVMFLEFLNDYLGVPLNRILARMPAVNGAPLGETYIALLNDHPNIRTTVGPDGKAAFQKMIALLMQNAQNHDGTLNLPADGNPFPSMPGAARGGLFAGSI